MENNQDKAEPGTTPEVHYKRRKDMSPEERVVELQAKLYRKAKQEKCFKFYVLYDKMLIPYLLKEAWRRVRSNGGAPGIDGVTISDIEAMGEEAFLIPLKEELRTQTYRPQAVKRVMIPKANGGERPLGIPTVKDRVVQMACKLIIEPIFEADFRECSYGYRPKRSAAGAIKAIRQGLKAGKTMVLDADLSKYFDTIPHDRLMIAVKERIADPRMLKLIVSWLRVPVFENKRFTSGKTGKGTPQGGVISPLLANIYLNLLDRIVTNPEGPFAKMGIMLVRYADDFVLMGKQLTTSAMERIRSLLDRMGLTLNEEKTHLRQAEEEPFDFLGFTTSFDKDLHGRNARYWNIRPSKKSEKKLREKIRSYLDTHGHTPAPILTQSLNAIMGGWLNYFDIEGITYPQMSKRRLRHYLNTKLYRYFNRKSQRKSRLYGHKAFEVLVSKFGLLDPTKSKTLMA